MEQIRPLPQTPKRATGEARGKGTAGHLPPPGYGQGEAGSDQWVALVAAHRDRLRQAYAQPGAFAAVGALANPATGYLAAADQEQLFDGLVGPVAAQTATLLAGAGPARDAACGYGRHARFCTIWRGRS